MADVTWHMKPDEDIYQRAIVVLTSQTLTAGSTVTASTVDLWAGRIGTAHFQLRSTWGADGIAGDTVSMTAYAVTGAAADTTALDATSALTGGNAVTKRETIAPAIQGWPAVSLAITNAGAHTVTVSIYADYMADQAPVRSD
jgi:hypothetical protein